MCPEALQERAKRHDPLVDPSYNFEKDGANPRGGKTCGGITSNHCAKAESRCNVSPNELRLCP